MLLHMIIYAFLGYWFLQKNNCFLPSLLKQLIASSSDKYTKNIDISKIFIRAKSTRSYLVIHTTSTNFCSRYYYPSFLFNDLFTSTLKIWALNEVFAFGAELERQHILATFILNVAFLVKDTQSYYWKFHYKQDPKV